MSGKRRRTSGLRLLHKPFVAKTNIDLHPNRGGEIMDRSDNSYPPKNIIIPE